MKNFLKNYTNFFFLLFIFFKIILASAFIVALNANLKKLFEK